VNESHKEKLNQRKPDTKGTYTVIPHPELKGRQKLIRGIRSQHGRQLGGGLWVGGLRGATRCCFSIWVLDTSAYSLCKTSSLTQNFKDLYIFLVCLINFCGKVYIKTIFKTNEIP
jgi:hypothetical protein